MGALAPLEDVLHLRSVQELVEALAGREEAVFRAAAEPEDPQFLIGRLRIRRQSRDVCAKVAGAIAALKPPT